MTVLASLLDTIAKCDQVNGNIVLFELLGETNQSALGLCRGVFEWRADKDHDALAQVLVLPMLKRKLRYGYRCGDGGGAP